MAYFFETRRLSTHPDVYKLRANSCFMVGPAKFSWLTAGPSMEIAQIPSALYKQIETFVIFMPKRPFVWPIFVRCQVYIAAHEVE